MRDTEPRPDHLDVEGQLLTVEGLAKALTIVAMHGRNCAGEEGHAMHEIIHALNRELVELRRTHEAAAKVHATNVGEAA
jgi:hypothetical protein